MGLIVFAFMRHMSENGFDRDVVIGAVLAAAGPVVYAIGARRQVHGATGG